MNSTKELDAVLSSRLKGKLSEKKIKNVQLAQDLNIAEMTISAKLNGKQPFSLGQFAYICARYDFTAGEVFEILNGVNGVFLPRM